MISKANVKNIYPLTPLQEGIFFHYLYESGASYFEQLSYRLKGFLEIAHFQSAWAELVRRHDVLRTIFVHKDVPRPLQIVLKQWRIDFTLVDLRGTSPHEWEARIADLKGEDRARPFNLAKEPLTRVMVILLADDGAEVVWSHHHIILDGWSAGILLGELLEIYAALLQGRRHALPEPVPFANYVTWIGKQNQTASRRFWEEYLEGFSQPTGIPGLAVGGTTGRDIHDLRLDDRRSAALAALASGNSVTLNVLLQTLWGILLCHCNGVPEAVFAATVSGRPEDLKGIEGMVGLFINAVPVRIRLDGAASFSGLLKKVQADSLAASRHHWCSLAEIQAETQLKQGLLDHILIFENYPLDERSAAVDMAGAGGFAIVGAEIRENTNYPLEVSIVPGREIQFRIGFDTQVYSRSQIERIGWSLEHLVDLVLATADIPLEQLSILSPRERNEILTEFNRPQGAQAAETVADILEQQAAQHPDRTALVCGSSRLSYGEVNQAANRVANHLQTCCKVRPDDVVGILMDRSERMLAALLGVIKSGAAYLPLDPAFPASRIAYMLEDSRCRVLLTEQKHRTLAAMPPGAAIIELDQLPDAPTANPARSARPDNLIYLIYTSGSTGLPKGVMLEHRNVISFNRNMAAIYGLFPGDTILALTTITFDISVLELICSLMSGMTVVLASDAVAGNPAKAAALLGECGVNVLQITPSRLKLMLEEVELLALSRLKALLVGGEPLPEHLFERLKALGDTALFNVYGPTEATIWSTSARLDDGRLTIGRPLVDEEVLILSPQGELLPSGTWGEICIGGQGLARGYWNRPELTAERFAPHPVHPGERIYRTGDLGRFLPDGTIQCGGRMDNQVKVRGYRIETGEIEVTLLKIAGIREAVAHVVEIDGLNEIVAYLVLDHGAVLSPAGIRAALAVTLPEYMLPSCYLTLERMPLTPNGKADRKALPLPDGSIRGQAVAGQTGFVALRNGIEVSLAAIWERILGVERVGRDDNFFDLGGHSIKAIRVVTAIAKELGKEIPLPALFKNPTVGALAAVITAGQDAELQLEPLELREWYQSSPGQRRIWVLQRMAPASSAYNMPLALQLKGRIHIGALQAASVALTERHESLRTVFAEQEGALVQLIPPSAGEVFSTVDLTMHHDPWLGALEAAAAQAAQPFDLTTAPLFKVIVYRTGVEEGLLLAVMHHAIGDGWSWGIMLSELAELYQAFAEGGEPSLAPLPVQYKEWADYQNRAFSSGRWESMRQYWYSRFAEPPLPLDLPLDFPRPQLRRDGGSSVSIALSPQLTASLNKLAQDHGATQFMVLLALLKTLLYRLTGQDDITVGIPVAGRPAHQLEGVVGFFVNTLALRDRLRRESSFGQLLDQIRETALEAYEHQLYPFDALVSELSLPRDTGRAPLFDVMAVLHEATDRPAFHALEVTGVHLPVEKSRFDLTFNFMPAAHGTLTVELEYASDLFLPQTAERMAERFRTLAESAAAAPHVSLDALNLLSHVERADLTSAAAGEQVDLTQGMSMVDLFRKQAAAFPGALAVSAADRTLTYAELDLLSDRCAAALIERHCLQPEEIVGVMTGRSSYLPVALLAVMKGGGVYLPIDPDQPESRIRHIIADSRVRTILADAETGEKVALIADAATVLDVDGLEQAAERDADLFARRPAPSDPAYVIYTSGSTGLPKGVLLEHGGFVNMIRDQIRTFGIRADDRCLLFSTFSFDGAMSEIFLALHGGAALVISRREQTADPEAFGALLKESGTTVSTLPPAYLGALRAYGATLDPLRVIITAGEAAIPADVIHYARKKAAFNAYGPTEASVCSAIHRLDPLHPYYGAIPIGCPMANSELLVLDDLLNPAPFGVTGEICVGGPGLARGYLNNPELTEDKFVPHPWRKGARLYRTGDQGRRLHDGSVEFLGRRDDQVKVRGYRIECGEVERAILKCPGVTAAVVVARGEGATKELVAFLIQDGETDQHLLAPHLAQLIPRYMIPARFVRLDAFPLNSHGKVDRKALGGMELAEKPALTDERPSTEMERRLAGIWEHVLERQGVARCDSFFEIGGQSISAIRLAGAIREQLEISLPLPVIFRYPLLWDMATQCEHALSFGAAFEDEPCRPISRGGQTNIFAFPPITGYCMAYTPLAEQLPQVNLYGFTFLEADDRLQRYLEIIKRIQPEGPLVLLGYSSGGNLAFEMTKELERHGRCVTDLILLDSWKRSPDAPRTDDLESWGEVYSPDPELYGNLAELMESPHIRQIAFGKMKRYLAYTESTVTTGVVDAVIHLVRAEDCFEMKGLSQEWREHTTAGCKVHQGSGTHLAMLNPPWGVENGRYIASDILDR